MELMTTATSYNSYASVIRPLTHLQFCASDCCSRVRRRRATVRKSRWRPFLADRDSRSGIIGWE